MTSLAIKRSLRHKLVRLAGLHDRAELSRWLAGADAQVTLFVAGFWGVKVPRSLRREPPELVSDWTWVPPRPRVELSREPTEDEKRQRILPGVTITLPVPLSCYVRNE